MGPYPYSSGSSSGSAPACSGPDMDGILAGAGYRVRSADLCHVANGLEQLEAASVLGAAAEAVHYNPSDLTTWVNSMLTELGSAQPLHPASHLASPVSDTWTDQICPPVHPNGQIAAVATRQQEEDTGIRLVHMLMSCADAVQRGDSGLAAGLVDEIRLVLSRVNCSSGIGKVAGYFADALFRRLYAAEAPPPSPSVAEYDLLYHHFYEACPYLKFAHFTANQAILEAFEGHDRVHVIDFSLMQGLQWPALIQALALRPGGPPFLRITGIGPPSPDGRDELREVGFRLAELARSVRVRFAFRGVAATRLDDVRPWMLQVARGEAVAINSVLQLHRLLGDPGTGPAPIDLVLEWIAGIRPKVVTVVEQEADHNKPGFLDRFTEALFYYSTMFDSLEAGTGGPHQKRQAAVAEMYLQREICNIVCCEGEARVVRHEPLVQWRNRLSRAGLTPVHLGSNAYRQASMLLTLFSGEGYCVEETDGCLTLGWHSRPLISATAWRGPCDDVAREDSGPVANISNGSNNHMIRSNGNYDSSKSAEWF